MPKQKRRERKKKSEEELSKRIKKRRKMQKQRTKETRILCGNTQNIIPKAPLGRLIREIVGAECKKMGKKKTYRLSKGAFSTLQASAENEITELFYISQLISSAHKKNTVNPPQMKIASMVRKIGGFGIGINSVRGDVVDLLKMSGRKGNFEVIRPNISTQIILEQDKEDVGEWEPSQEEKRRKKKKEKRKKKRSKKKKKKKKKKS